MDAGGRTVRAWQAVKTPWLVTLAVASVALVASAIASAQAPPPFFFDGRSAAELRALASDLHNDTLLRRGAATRLVIILADGGDFDSADAAAKEFERDIDPGAIKYAHAVRRRSGVHTVALVAVAAVSGIALVSVARAGRRIKSAWPAARRALPVVGFFFAYAAIVGGFLASSYENSSAVPFWLFASLMGPLALGLRLWGALGSPRVEARIGRAVAAVAVTVAVGFLVVEHVNPSYLEGFGL